MIHVGGQQAENLAFRQVSMCDLAACRVEDGDPVLPAAGIAHAQAHLALPRALEIGNAKPAAPAYPRGFLRFPVLGPEAPSIAAVECFEHALGHACAEGPIAQGDDLRIVVSIEIADGHDCTSKGMVDGDSPGPDRLAIAQRESQELQALVHLRIPGVQEHDGVE